MNGSRVKPSKSLQETLPVAVASMSTRPVRRSARVQARQLSTDRIASTGRLRKPAERPSTPLPEPKGEWQEQVSPASLLRIRHIDRDSDIDNGSENQPRRTRLTRKNLALFNKVGKNKAKKALASALSDSTGGSSTTKTTSTTSSGFAIQAYRNSILDTSTSKPPTNLKDMRQRLARSRQTASPTESVYEHYVDRVNKACNEATMVFEVGGKLLKEYKNKDHRRAFNQAFTAFPKDVGFNNSLSAPQPDFFEGLNIREYDPFPIDQHISGAVLYKDDLHSVTLPHIAGEWKGRGKNMEEAKLQSAYNGAALIYGRSRVLDSIGKPDIAGYANVITFTTDGTNLNFFAHYTAPSERGTPQYHQYPITSTNLKNSFEEFKKARKQLRNAQDNAREEPYELRDQLKEHWEVRESQLAPLLPIEDEGDHEVIEQRPSYQPMPSTSSKPELDKALPSHSSRSTASSPPPVVDFASSGSGHKRKATSSRLPKPSRKLVYWKVDDVTGRPFHVHRDRTLAGKD